MTGLSCVIYGSRRALPRRCPAMTGLSCVIYPDEHCPGMSSHDWVELCDIWIQTSIAQGCPAMTGLSCVIYGVFGRGSASGDQ